MTPRERLTAAVKGEEVDQKPIIVWPNPHPEADATIVGLEAMTRMPAQPMAVLVKILNPFGRAILADGSLSELIQEDPKEGEKVLDILVDETSEEISRALAQGADGIFYRLRGAEPNHCTPMQYGGHYLERDREILGAIPSEKLSVLFVEGGPETYWDFISDLPAGIFAWDKATLPIEVDAVRKMRNGPLATADPSADVLFGSDFNALKAMQREEVAKAHA